jgi:23S rRNA pseudouridine1911/1915/1917 synthase
VSGAPADGWREHVVRPYEEGRSLEEIVARAFGLARHEVAALGRSRGVRLNGRPAPLGARARHADTVAIRTGAAPTASGIEPTAMPLAIVHEDDALLVLDKPPYMLVHPTEPAQAHTLANGVAHHRVAHGRDGGIHPVHRLDRDTSGLVVFALTPAAHRALAGQLAAVPRDDVRGAAAARHGAAARGAGGLGASRR